MGYIYERQKVKGMRERMGKMHSYCLENADSYNFLEDKLEYA